MGLRSWTQSLCILALAGSASAQPMDSVWRADANQRPEDVCPAWKLVDTAPSAHPILVDGKLVLATDAPAQDMFYTQTTALKSPLPDPIVVEATVRFGSGTSNVPNRGPIAIDVSTAANTGALFFVGNGEIFLTADGDVRGQSAAVDTTATAHTYHIEVTRAGAVSVAYDGTPTLTGATYTSAAAFGGAPRILWGEGSKFATGRETWTAFQHNAAVCSPATTPTTLPSQCTGMTPGSLDDVDCRLEALGAQIAADATLGSFGPKLGSQLQRATALARQGDDACGSNDVKTASRRMKQAQKLLQKMEHRLSGLSARKRLDATVRTSFIGTIHALRSDVGALRKNPCS
jgi:hypothetical protein